MKRTLAGAVLLLLILVQAANADRGLWVIRWRIRPLPPPDNRRHDELVPPDWDPYDGVAAPPPIALHEPKQEALLSWNGTEEILLLATDLRASHPSQVLEVLPLPSEPKVDKGDLEVLKKAMTLIHAKQPRRGRRGVMAAAPGGEVTQQKKIGAHNISVTHVLNNEEFVDWVEKYLKELGVTTWKVPDSMRKTIGEYLQEGYKWFVFDVVEVGTETASHDAIQYRFKSDCVYYPLKITRDTAGETDIRLFVLTPQMLRRFEGIPRREVVVPLPPVILNRREVAELDKEVADLLKDFAAVQLRYWELGGKLSEFTKDIVVKP